MEKLFVFSDLHGDKQALELVVSRIEEEQVNQIIFAGDFGLERLGTQQFRLNNLGIQVIMVRGNCDSPWIFSHVGMIIPQLYNQIPFGPRRILITHGHLYHTWDSTPITLSHEDIFICGHTHRSKLIYPDGEPLQINPGSVSSPRDALPPTYAIISHNEASIKNLETGHTINQLLF